MDQGSGVRQFGRGDELLAGFVVTGGDFRYLSARIREAMCLLAPGGRAVAGFLLRIEGGAAWWRWSGEALPGTAAGP